MMITVENIGHGPTAPLAGCDTLTRSEALPDTPTVATCARLRGERSVWDRRAPEYTRRCYQKLNGEINAALADPKIKARIAELGGMGLAGSPRGLRKALAEETEKWAKVVKFSGAKPANLCDFGWSSHIVRSTGPTGPTILTSKSVHSGCLSCDEPSVQSARKASIAPMNLGHAGSPASGMCFPIQAHELGVWYGFWRGGDPLRTAPRPHDAV